LAVRGQQIQANDQSCQATKKEVGSNAQQIKNGDTLVIERKQPRLYTVTGVQVMTLGKLLFQFSGTARHGALPVIGNRIVSARRAVLFEFHNYDFCDVS